MHTDVKKFLKRNGIKLAGDNLAQKTHFRKALSDSLKEGVEIDPIAIEKSLMQLVKPKL